MQIADIKAFSDKYGTRGDKDEVIAKESGFTVEEVHEAREFLKTNFQISWDFKQQMWTQQQYAKTHPYVAPQPTGTGVPNVFGPSAGVKTICNISEQEYWKKMEDLLRKVTGKA